VSLRSAMLAAVFAASPSLACAPVAGEGRYVRIETEEAFIIWDAGTKTEHFIRRAAFDTNAKDFGFLVPTPTQPELAEASDLVFSRLAQITATPQPASKAAAEITTMKAAPVAPVTVLERKTVAGLDVAVLAATDANALDAWLKQHGYRSSPDLVEWYKPYVAKGWKITAFKIAGDARKIDTAAVRMSFQTEQPFFPYREPASQRAAGGEPSNRLLRVYFLAEQRVKGTIGAEGEWPAATRWAKTIEDADRDRLLQLVALPYTTAPSAFWLTRLEDASSPRPGTDEVYFSRAADQSPMVAAAAHRSQSDGALWIYIAAGVVLGAIGAWQLRQRKRKSHG
jgi:hypothetical protein